MNERNCRFQMAAALLGICLISGGCLSAGGTFYTRIDESGMTQRKDDGVPVDLPAGNMEYSWTLPCFDAGGKRVQLTFGSDEKLKDGTWLELKSEWLRGVMSWNPVSEQEVPEGALRAWQLDEEASNQ